MRVHLQFQVYESITDKEAIGRLRQLAGDMMGRFMATGKVESSGVFPGIRGGYIVMDADSSEEVFELIGDAHEVLRITSHLVVSLETLGEFFESHPPV